MARVGRSGRGAHTTRPPRSPTALADGLLTQGQVLGAVNELTDPRDVVLCAAGSMPGDLHKLWRVRDRKAYHVEYGYSCMGYEMPASIGIRLADETRDVFAMVGDGGYLMMPTELVTAVQERVKVIVVLVQNHGFHSIGSLSESLGSQRFGTRYRVPRRVVRPARRRRAARRPRGERPQPRGARHRGALRVDELEQAIKEAKAAPADGGPVVIHVETDPLVHAPDSDVVVGRAGLGGQRPRLDADGLRRVRRPQGHPAPAPHPRPPEHQPDRPGVLVMKLALDPYMFRETPLLELPSLVADLGYEWIELSPRDDFIPFFNHPRVDDAGVAAFRTALRSAGVGVSSVLPLFRWCGSRRGGPQGGGALLDARHPDRLDARRRHDELGVQRQPARGGDLRADVLAVDGGAAARLREGGDPARARAAPRRLGGGRQARGRPHQGDQQPQRLASSTARRTPSTRATTATGSWTRPATC